MHICLHVSIDMTRINISVYIPIVIDCSALPASTATAISSATTKETTEDILEIALNETLKAAENAAVRVCGKFAQNRTRLLG